jgi:hypothetical protein
MIYLDLYHGRRTLEEDMDDWGEQGPIFGPLDLVQGTYGTELKCHFRGNVVFLPIVEGLVYYNGMYYGDWSIADVHSGEQTPGLPDQELARRPNIVPPSRQLPTSLPRSKRGVADLLDRAARVFDELRGLDIPVDRITGLTWLSQMLVGTAALLRRNRCRVCRAEIEPAPSVLCNSCNERVLSLSERHGMLIEAVIAHCRHESRGGT